MAERIINFFMFTGGAATAVGWFAQIDWVATGGFIMVLLTFISNLYFKRKEDRRKQERWDLERRVILSEHPSLQPERRD